MEACWEYLACHKVECAMYGRRDVRCWEHDDACCNHEAAMAFRGRPAPHAEPADGNA
ncbi:MAG: hypothetical protein IPK64_00480 [bacterium]|nr:hypothetical protein [bacterium]